jgi:psiF repeat
MISSTARLPAAASMTREMTMKTVFAMLCGLMLVFAPVHAQEKKAEAPKKEPSEAQKKQQQRMADCNAKAGSKGMKGDDRNKFMSSCLKGEDAGPSAKQKAQQDKMASCNAKAGEKGMKGDARQKFMSECLKG